MSVDASLDSLRAYVGATSTKDDALLAQALDAAGTWIRDRIMVDRWNHSDVQQATLMLSARLYRRRQSTEGVVGVGGEGLVVRISQQDVDITKLLERHLDYYKAGIA